MMTDNTILTSTVDGDIDLQWVDPDITVTATVAASVANLGAGFDSVGLAVGIYDTVELTTTASGVVIDIDGYGANELPKDANHLIVRAFRQGLITLGYQCPGILLRCSNSIPQAKGLGSSAAAFAVGLQLASLVAQSAQQPAAAMLSHGLTRLTQEQMVNLAGHYEGHADNSSASILGGAVVSWAADNSYYATPLTVHPDIIITVCIPQVVNFTTEARNALPEKIPFPDSVFNISRAAVLPLALSLYPELLYAATDDKIHQQYREYQMPDSMELVHHFRNQWGYPAMIGGAGPTVVCLTTTPLSLAAQDYARNKGFKVQEVAVGNPLT